MHSASGPALLQGCPWLEAKSGPTVQTYLEADRLATHSMEYLIMEGQLRKARSFLGLYATGKAC